MSHPTTSSSFHPLFNAVLQDHGNQTGTKLDEHSIAKQLEKCDTVDSITSFLREQARKFHEFKSAVHAYSCLVYAFY